MLPLVWFRHFAVVIMIVLGLPRYFMRAWCRTGGSDKRFHALRRFLDRSASPH